MTRRPRRFVRSRGRRRFTRRRGFSRVTRARLRRLVKGALFRSDYRTAFRLKGLSGATLYKFGIPEIFWTQSPKYPAYISKLEYEFAISHTFASGTATGLSPDFKAHVGFFAVAIPKEGVTIDAPATDRTGQTVLPILQDTSTLSVEQMANIAMQRIRFPPGQPSTRLQKRRWKWLALRTINMPYLPKQASDGRTDPVVRTRLAFKNLKLIPGTVVGLAIWLSQDENDTNYQFSAQITRKAYARPSTSVMREDGGNDTVNPFKIIGNFASTGMNADSRTSNVPSYVYVASINKVGQYERPANNVPFQLT